PGGWPEPFRSKVLAGREVSLSIPELSGEDRAALEADPGSRRDTLNRLLFPGPTRAFVEVREQYGDLSVLGSMEYLYGLVPGREHLVELEPGVTLIIALEAIGEADAKGMRTVLAVVNGQLRPVFVRDNSLGI